ncbi:MAG: hypothetical protein ACTHNW_00260 [Mucilaginibacter sp.]
MNKLLKYIFVLLFVVCTGYQSYAQYYPVPPPGARIVVRQNSPENRVLNVKERFIKKQLRLTPEQAQKFYPLYHEYQMELFNMQRLKRLNNSSVQPDGTDQVNKDLFYETQIIKIKQRFKDAFLKVLPPEKVSELYKSEREFNDELVRSLSERNGNQRN